MESGWSWKSWELVLFEQSPDREYGRLTEAELSGAYMGIAWAGLI